MFSPFMCYHASIHVDIKSSLLNFFFQSFNEIMSFSFNRVYAQALFIFLREFSYKSLRIHLWSLGWSHRRNSSLVPKSISLLEFWKLDLVFWFQKNNLMFFQKWYFQHSTCRMTIESSNSIIEVTIINKKKRKKKNKMNKHPYPMTFESCVFKCMNNGM